MDDLPTIPETGCDSVADPRSAREAAVSRVTENACLRDELLLQTQQLDALLKLTGDVAQGLGSSLSAILAFAELLQTRLAEDPEGLHVVGEIIAAAERGWQQVNRLPTAQSSPSTQGWTCDRR
jgi:hypothetical protein